ncbi:mucin-2-like [Liolophura sinensis]|uniref:mucin-2-like n=1 Tax=Liolophura sinensis TaxID=3198878 RepID=UPI003158BBCF
MIMPPPKKPKKGPTTADQFLTEDELNKLHSQRLLSTDSESSDQLSRRNSSPLLSDDQLLETANQGQSRSNEDSKVFSHVLSADNKDDLPMNLSSSDNHTNWKSEDKRVDISHGTNSSRFTPHQNQETFSTSNYVQPSNHSFGLAVPKTEPGLGYSEPEPPVLQRMTDTASPTVFPPNRYSSPSHGTTASPTLPHRIQAPPVLLQRHQSPMLTLMMAGPSSHAIWQSPVGVHDSVSPHSPHFPPLQVPLASLDNVLAHTSSQPHDFSKKSIGRSDGTSRKRKPRYSLLSAALSGSVTSTSTVHHNVTVSTSASESRAQPTQPDQKRAMDILRTSAPPGTAFMGISPADTQSTSADLQRTSADVHQTSAEPCDTDGARTSLVSTAVDMSDTSTSGVLRTMQSGNNLYRTVSNSSQGSLDSNSQRNGVGNQGRMLIPNVSSVPNSQTTNTKLSHRPSSARLIMGGLVAAVNAPPGALISGLTPLTPDSPVFVAPGMSTDSAGTLHTDVTVASKSRLSSHTSMTSSHDTLTSPSHSFPGENSRDGGVSEASRRDSSQDADEDLGVSPMQSPISSTSMSAIGPAPASLPPVCSSSCLLPEERSIMNGSSSSIETDSGSGIMGMESNFGDPSKVVCKQEEQLPGSSTSNSVSRQCQVCNDGASGFHYGVWSCEGCKAFFKRSIQGPVDYICPATNNCTIDKHRRKSCQACRLRKCYEVGMTKGTSQRKERRSSSTSSANTPVSRPRKRQRTDSTALTNGTKAKRLGHMAVIVLDALIQADTPILESLHDHSLPPSKTHLLSSLLKLVDRELVYLINWAKHVQGYTDLVLCDQVHLIECCWMELLLLSCAFRSVEYQGKQLVFASDLVLDRQIWYVLDMVDVLEQVAAISAQMAFYGVHKEELLLLKALSLTNAEVRQLSNPGLLSNMRSNLIDALTATAQKHHPQNWGYVPSLMLLLAHIRQASLQTIGHLQKLKNEGVVPFCDLLKEMLEAQSLPSEEKSALSQCG